MQHLWPLESAYVCTAHPALFYIQGCPCFGQETRGHNDQTLTSLAIEITSNKEQQPVCPPPAPNS